MKQSNIMQQRQPTDQLLTDITSQITLIKQQNQDQTRIYKKCLQQFKNHLESEVKQLEDSQTVAAQKNKLIENTYELIYQNIHQYSDEMLRYIRCTQQAKKQFWSQKIKDFASQPNLELKREFYLLKKDAQDRYLDAIDERKTMKFPPFAKLFLEQEKNKELINYQRHNAQLERNTTIGSFFKVNGTWKGNSLFDNKQNSMRQLLNQNVQLSFREKHVQQEGQNSDLLRKFMRR